MKYSRAHDTAVAGLELFSPSAEARIFIGLVFRGVMTSEQAREAITMTPKQLQHLIENGMALPMALHRLYALRQKTLIEFNRMVVQAGRKAVAA